MIVFMRARSFRLPRGDLFDNAARPEAHEICLGMIIDTACKPIRMFICTLKVTEMPVWLLVDGHFRNVHYKNIHFNWFSSCS